MKVHWHISPRLDCSKYIKISRRLKNESSISRRNLYRDSIGCCWYCGDDIDKRSFHIDHLIPRSAGGSDHRSNLIPCCKSCNTSKGNISIADWYGRWAYSRWLSQSTGSRVHISKDVFDCLCEVDQSLPDQVRSIPWDRLDRFWIESVLEIAGMELWRDFDWYFENGGE